MTSLTPEAVVDRALDLADAEGLAAVSMRRLAGELGVTPMALYWHFRTKEALLDAMVDRVFSEVDLQPPVDAPWRRRLSDLLWSFLRAVRGHPAAPELLTRAGATCENRLLTQEAALDILARAGFSPAEATQIVGHATSTLLSLTRGQVGRTDEAESRRIRAFLHGLPPDRFPRTIEAAEPISVCEDPDTYYEFGITMLLAGIDALAKR
ncbi:AcrR family transcriptional regulator [Lipingzhangella halophila]|uniref:AcrR family transcriptional regulator n=1 Tax=Lipingzhangella halophila TaxID=1783352 RepID=A0A7W7RQ58_9ACTN|nr:TetR family transcriptional regulator [Lipingzhangella halophila]MBB4935531.1 AcrR family transcriptional regulator [Lipingzhangella halophila]